LDNEIVQLACASTNEVSKLSFPGSFVQKLRPDLANIPTDKGETGGPLSLNGALRREWYKATFKLDYLMHEGISGRLSNAVGRLPFDKALPLRHKYLDYRAWMKGPLSHYVQETIFRHGTFLSDIPGRNVVNRILSDYRKGIANELTDVNTLLSLALIDQCLVRSRPQTNSNVRAENLVSAAFQ
jgi:hypothetical protein